MFITGSDWKVRETRKKGKIGRRGKFRGGNLRESWKYRELQLGERRGMKKDGGLEGGLLGPEFISALNYTSGGLWRRKT